MGVAYRYERAGVNGLGFLTEFAGVPVHVIAWGDAEVQRIPLSHPGVSELSITPLDGDGDSKPATETPSETTEATEPAVSELPWAEWKLPDGESEAATIRSFLGEFGTDVENKLVIDALAERGMQVSSSQVTAAKRVLTKDQG